ncbi:MAG: 4Fe-4S binding protein, partial [Desulfovibrionaceae bacterium]
MGLVLPVVALLALAAHFWRAGEPGWAAAGLGLAGLLTARRAWVRVGAAWALAAGTGVWGLTAGRLVEARLALGLPWRRGAVILLAVAALTALAAAGLRARAAGAGEPGAHAARRGEPWATGAALLAAGLLALTREASPLPVLLLDRFAPGWGGLEVFGLALYAGWLTGRMLAARDTARLRLALWAGFSVVFFGQLLLGLAGASELLMTGRLHLPVPALILAGPAYRGGGWFMLLLFASTVALAGPAWCSHLCYVGAWDNVAARGRGDRGKTARPISRSWLWGGRAAILAMVLAVAYALRRLGVPPETAVWPAAGFGLAGVAVMAFVSRRRGVMAHCTAWCPVGLAAVLLGRLNPFRIRMRPECTRCGACARACRYGALDATALERGRAGLSCTLCGDCLGACPRGDLGFRFPGLSPATARGL